MTFSKILTNAIAEHQDEILDWEAIGWKANMYGYQSIEGIEICDLPAELSFNLESYYPNKLESEPLKNAKKGEEKDQYFELLRVKKLRVSIKINDLTFGSIALLVRKGNVENRKREIPAQPYTFEVLEPGSSSVVTGLLKQEYKNLKELVAAVAPMLESKVKEYQETAKLIKL